MRILNDDNVEIQESDIDLSIGECHIEFYVDPSAYDTIDNITKFALDDSDYEEILRYHVYTQAEIEMFNRAHEEQKKQEILEKMIAEVPQTIEAHSEMINDITLIIAEMIGTN